MISKVDLYPVGKFLKPHGVNGEISILREDDFIDFNDHNCIIVDVDGIFVPFFLESVRTKGSDTDLVKIDGITNEIKASTLANKTVYVLRSELTSTDTDKDSEEGFYAEDFIEFAVITPDNGQIGKIIGIDDSTENYLFIVEKIDGNNLLIPVADEFITDIDTTKREIEMDLPEGLFDL